MPLPGWCLSNIFFISRFGDAKLFAALSNAVRSVLPSGVFIAESCRAVSSASFSTLFCELGNQSTQFGVCVGRGIGAGGCASKAETVIVTASRMKVTDASCDIRFVRAAGGDVCMVLFSFR